MSIILMIGLAVGLGTFAIAKQKAKQRAAEKKMADAIASYYCKRQLP